MNKYLKYSLIAVLVVAAIGITVVGVVYAQTDDPPRPHELLAELLGMTEYELMDAMRSGKTLEELAEEADIDLDQILQTFKDSRGELFKSRLEEAYQNGDISKDQYHWMLEGYENGLFGRGKGPGGFFGPGMFSSEGLRHPFDFNQRTRPFHGRGGFGGYDRPGMDCGRDWFDD